MGLYQDLATKLSQWPALFYHVGVTDIQRNSVKKLWVRWERMF